jgi:hypothetical protein
MFLWIQDPHARWGSSSRASRDDGCANLQSERLFFPSECSFVRVNDGPSSCYEQRRTNWCARSCTVLCEKRFCSSTCTGWEFASFLFWPTSGLFTTPSPTQIFLTARKGKRYKSFRLVEISFTQNQTSHPVVGGMCGKPRMPHFRVCFVVSDLFAVHNSCLCPVQQQHSGRSFRSRWRRD